MNKQTKKVKRRSGSPERRAVELALLQEMQEQWRRVSGLDEAVALLCRTLHDQVRLPLQAVLLFERETQLFSPTGSGTIDAELLARLTKLAGEYWEAALTAGQVMRTVRVKCGRRDCRFTLAYLLAGLELVGVVLVGEEGGGARALAGRRRRLLEIIATQGAAVIHDLRPASHVTQRKVVGAPALYQEARPVNLRTGATRVFVPIVDLVCATFPHTGCALYLLEAGQHVLRLVVARPAASDETVIDVDEDPLITELVREGKALLINDVAAARRDGISNGSPRQVRSLMAVCMVLEGTVIGTINLTNAAPNVYTENDLRHLSIIANHAALIYHTASNLLHLQAVFQDVLESVPVGIVALDHQTQTALANRMAGTLLGVPPAQRQIRYAETLERLATVNYRRPTPQTGWPGPYEVKVSVAGLERIVKVRHSPLRVKETEAIGDVIVLEDVTAEKKLEKQMARAERMAVLGELSAGIAHEIKNPLTSIKGFAQLLPQKYDNEKFRQKFTAVINNEVDRLNQIVEGMLSFAAPKVRTFAACDVNHVLHQVFLLVEHQCRKQNIELRRELGGQVRVHGDAHGLEQVFLNIVVNAIEVMPQGGTLTVTTVADPVQGGAQVIVRDTGPGIPAEIIGKIYNPFFTTKAHGTGLGLAISYRIIDEHGGVLDVHSDFGKGTVFTITLPLYREKNDALPPAGR